MPIRFSDLAPALLGGAAAAAGGPMAARPIRRAAQYADDARSLKAQHERNMDDWEQRFEEQGNAQRVIDYAMSLNEGDPDSPEYHIVSGMKAAGRMGDVEGVKQLHGQLIRLRASSASEMMAPTPEEVEQIRGGLQPGDSRTISYKGGSQTIHGPSAPGEPKYKYYTVQKPDGKYVAVFDEDQQRVIRSVLVDEVDTKAEKAAEAPDIPAELSDAAYRRLLRKRALWGKPTGNAEIDSMSQQEARVELDSYTDSELAYSKADALQSATLGPNSAPGAAQGGGGATTPLVSSHDARAVPSSPSTGQTAGASTTAATPETKIIPGNSPVSGKWVKNPAGGWDRAQ